MPRLTRDLLANYHFAVGTHQTTGHEVHVPPNDDARRELARQLTGGVVVAPPGALRAN